MGDTRTFDLAGDKMINKIRKAIEINREINNYEEDAALHHCPFDNCEVCEFIFGDEIVGGLVDGFYAYYFETSSTSSPVNGWRIMEIQSNLVADILVCDAGNNCVNP